MRRNRTHTLQDLIGSEVPEGFDKAPLIAEIKALKTHLPNGNASRITEVQLAKWAGLEADHELIYSRLSPYCHFDFNSTLQEYAYAENRKDDAEAERGMQALHLPIKVELLLVAMRINLYVLMGMRDFGNADVTDHVEEMAAMLQKSEEIWAEANVALGRFIETLAT